MHKMMKIIVLFFSLQTAVFAAELQYAAVIDAGSSGSRLHLYQYSITDSLPQVSEIFNAATMPGLSAFSEHPEQAGVSLAVLLDGTNDYLSKHHIDANQVNISVLGTGGMRLLSQEKQDAIYASVRRYLQIHYKFKVQQVQTITGKMEGIYGWLDVNYLAGRLQSPVQTLGSIDIGGASTQIVYESSDLRFPDDEVHLLINGSDRVVFSKSFIGLGLDESRKELNQATDAASCYPSNYPLSNVSLGHFNLAQCELMYGKLLREHRVTQSMPTVPDREFIAYSGAYNTMVFFGAIDRTNQGQLETKLSTACNVTWDNMKHNHPNEPEYYLANYCANGVYIDELLYSEYQLHDAQVTIASEMNKQSIDWAMGALLYKLLMH